MELKNDCSEVYKKAVKEILNKEGLANAPVVIKSVKEIDLDGNGVKEEIIEADNIEEEYVYDSTTIQDMQVVKDENIHSPDSLKTFDKIGYYRIILVGINNHPQVIWQDFRLLQKEDFTFQTNKELGFDENEDDRCYKSNYLLKLYSNVDQVLMYQPYDVAGGGEACEFPESGAVIVDVLDVNNDNKMEVILKEFAPGYSAISVFAVDNGQISTKMKRECNNY